MNGLWIKGMPALKQLCQYYCAVNRFRVHQLRRIVSGGRDVWGGGGLHHPGDWWNTGALLDGGIWSLWGGWNLFAAGCPMLQRWASDVRGQYEARRAPGWWCGACSLDEGFVAVLWNSNVSTAMSVYFFIVKIKIQNIWKKNHIQLKK